MDGRRNFYNPSQMQGFYGDSAEYQQYFPFYHSMQSGETPTNTLQTMPQLWMANTQQASASQVSVSQASASHAGSSQASQTRSSPAGSSTSSSSPSSPEAADQPGKRAYDRWSNDEEKMLINLWAENLDRINSSQARKAWDEIGKQMNLKFGTKRATEKYQKKIKYLVDRYKIAKDWNSKQTGGHLRHSAHFEEIDAVMGCREIVTLGNVKEAGSAVSEREEATSEEGDCIEKKEARTLRKKTKKREREEENENEDRKMFPAAFTGLETQRNDMNNFVNNFTRIQEQQLTTMNALVGALSKFLEKQ